MAVFLHGTPSEPSLAEGSCPECVSSVAKLSAVVHVVRRLIKAEISGNYMLDIELLNDKLNIFQFTAKQNTS